MQKFLLEREQWIPRPVGEVFSFFSRPENLQVITPRWLDFSIIEKPIVLEKGSLIRYRLRWHGLPLSWTSEIAEWNPPHRFIDVALNSPYALWHHEHRFFPQGGGTLMRDKVTYALPLGWIGAIVHRLRVRREVESIFDYRSATLRRIFPA